MVKNILITAAITLVIAAISWGLAYWRIEALSSPKDVAAKGYQAVRAETSRFYALVGIFCGVVSFFVYRWMSGRYPNNPQTLFNQPDRGLVPLIPDHA